MSKDTQYVAEQNVRHNMLIFIFGMDRAKLLLAAKVPILFWQRQPLLAVRMQELVAFILGSIFFAVKSVFGRILAKNTS